MIFIPQSHKIITAASVEPVTLNEAKLHLKMDGVTADDALIETLIEAARQSAEEYCGIKFIDTVVEDVFDRFPKGGFQKNDCFYLMIGNVSSVDYVKYYDENGDLQTWNASQYLVDNYRKQARICLMPNVTFPTYDSDRANGVLVRYNAGFGATAADVPAVIKQAILLIIGYLYNNREDKIKNLPSLSEHLLQPYKAAMI